MALHQNNESLKETLLQNVIATLKEIHAEAATLSNSPLSSPPIGPSLAPHVHHSLPSRSRPPPVPAFSAASFCEALDAVFFHGLRLRNRGYWPLATQITRKSAIKEILGLTNVKTDVARGRAWLLIALNETSMESYFRFMSENEAVVKKFYTRYSIFRDSSRLEALVMLISGLEFVHFENIVDVPFLDNSFFAKSVQNVASPTHDDRMTNASHSSDANDVYSKKPDFARDCRQNSFEEDIPLKPELEFFYDDDDVLSEHLTLGGFGVMQQQRHHHHHHLQQQQLLQQQQHEGSNKEANLRIGLRSLSLDAGECKDGSDFHSSTEENSRATDSWLTNERLEIQLGDANLWRKSEPKQSANVNRASTVSAEPDTMTSNVASKASTTELSSTVDAACTTSTSVTSATTAKSSFEGRIERVMSIQSNPDEDLQVFSKSRSKRNSKSNQSKRNTARDWKDYGRRDDFSFPLGVTGADVVESGVEAERFQESSNKRAPVKRSPRDRSGSVTSSHANGGRKQDRADSSASYLNNDDKKGEKPGEGVPDMEKEKEGMKGGKEGTNAAGAKKEETRKAAPPEVITFDDDAPLSGGGSNFGDQKQALNEIFLELDRQEGEKGEEEKEDGEGRRRVVGSNDARTNGEETNPSRRSFSRGECRSLKSYDWSQNENVAALSEDSLDDISWGDVAGDLACEREEVEGEKRGRVESDIWREYPYREDDFDAADVSPATSNKRLRENLVDSFRLTQFEAEEEEEKCGEEKRKAARISSENVNAEEVERNRPNLDISVELPHPNVGTPPLEEAVDSFGPIGLSSSTFYVQLQNEEEAATATVTEEVATATGKSGMETIDNLLCDIEKGDERGEQMKADADSAVATQQYPGREEKECIPMSNNLLLLFDLHVLQFEEESLDSAYGVFVEFTGGNPKAKVVVLTNRAIYLLSTNENDVNSGGFVKEEVIPFAEIEQINLGLGLQYFTISRRTDNAGELKLSDAIMRTSCFDIATGSQSKSGVIVEKVSSLSGVEIEADLTKRKASLRRVATKELSKFSNSFTSTGSSLLFYALIFFDEGDDDDDREKTKHKQKGKEGTGNQATTTTAERDGFLSMKPTQTSSSSSSSSTSAMVASASAAVHSLKQSIANRIPTSMTLPSPIPNASALFPSTSSQSSLSSSVCDWSRTYFILRDGKMVKFDAETQEWNFLFDQDSIKATKKEETENQFFPFHVTLTDGTQLHFAAETDKEREMWLQCLRNHEDSSFSFEDEASPYLSASIALTSQGLLFCHEDLDSSFVRPLSATPLTEVLGLSIDTENDLFCALTLDGNADNQFELLKPKTVKIFFLAEKEKNSFVNSISAAWEQVFQVPLPVDIIEDATPMDAPRQFSSNYSKLLAHPFKG